MVGSLKDKITVLSTSSVDDGIGGLNTSHSDDFETWANVSPMTGIRSLEYYKIFNKQPYKVVLRYRKSQPITAEMRLKWKSKEMLIHSVVETKNEQFIELIAYHSD